MDRLLSPNKDILPDSASTPRYSTTTRSDAPLSQLQNLSTYNASVMLQQATQTTSPRLHPQTTQTNITSTQPRTSQTSPPFSPTGQQVSCISNLRIVFSCLQMFVYWLHNSLQYLTFHFDTACFDKIGIWKYSTKKASYKANRFCFALMIVNSICVVYRENRLLPRTNKLGTRV